MSWTDVLTNPIVVGKIYGEPPSLNAVRLMEVRFREEMPDVILRFDVRDFPNPPPARWVERGYNQVQIRLCFTEATGLSLISRKRWDSAGDVDVSMERVGKLIEFSAIGPDVSLTGKAEFVRIELNAYTIEEEWRLRSDRET